MADAITIKALQDASLDAKSLEEVVNGNEAKQVTTRLGETYPSAKKAIKTLFENGGLPATPFATKALMTASALVDGDYAQVTDDTVNNGLYIKEAGAWVKSSYDPTALANSYTDDAVITTLTTVQQKIDRVAEIRSDQENKNLVDFVDTVGSTYAFFDDKADLYLSAMPNQLTGKSIQESLDAAPTKSTTHSQDFIQVVDATDNVVMKLDGKGHLHIPFLDKSLQHSLESVLPVINQKRRLEKEFFTDSLAKYTNHLVTTGNPIAPMALGLLPSNYTIPDTIIDNLTDEGEHTPIYLDSPYLRNDDFVHPCIIECQGSFRGYRYLLMINPFYVEYWENPTIYGSNNLLDFDLLEGFHQPIAHADHDNTDYRSFLSDSCWSYDPVNGELLAMWRSSYWENGAPLANVLTDYRYSRTTDLLHWTDEEIYIPAKPESEEMRRSPSVLFNPNDGLWYMFSSPVIGRFEVRTAKQLHDEWSDPIAVPLPSSVRTWHQEVKYVGNKFVALFDNRDAGLFYMGISTDGIAWTISTTPLFTTSITLLYKGSFIPELTADGSGIFFHIFYTWYNRARRPMQLMHAKTNTIAI